MSNQEQLLASPHSLRHGCSSLMVSSAPAVLVKFRLERGSCAELDQWFIEVVDFMLPGTSAYDWTRYHFRVPLVLFPCRACFGAGEVGC